MRKPRAARTSRSTVPCAASSDRVSSSPMRPFARSLPMQLMRAREDEGKKLAAVQADARKRKDAETARAELERQQAEKRAQAMLAQQKSEERKLLSRDDLTRNAAAQRQQLERFLDFSQAKLVDKSHDRHAPDEQSPDRFFRQFGTPQRTPDAQPAQAPLQTVPRENALRRSPDQRVTLRADD